MLRLGIAACAVGALALADGFTFTIGSPVASQDFQAKSAAFEFRTERFAEPAKSQVDATAEGFVKGARRSVPQSRGHVQWLNPTRTWRLCT